MVSLYLGMMNSVALCRVWSWTHQC